MWLTVIGHAGFRARCRESAHPMLRRTAGRLVRLAGPHHDALECTERGVHPHVLAGFDFRAPRLHPRTRKCPRFVEKKLKF